MGPALHLPAAAALAAVLAAAGCHRQRVPGAPPAPAEDLAGLEAPLYLSGGLRASVAGAVNGRPAEVALELALPMTEVARGCFQGEPPPEIARVRYADPRQGQREAPQVSIARLDVAGRHLGRVDAALVEGDACGVTLGGDLLDGRALFFDPAARTVRIAPGRERSAWTQDARAVRPDEEEAWVIALGVDPRADWPLLTFRATQARRLLIGPAVLSTASVTSEVYASAAATADFRAGPAILRDLGLPSGVSLPASMGGDVFAIESLELAPGVSVKNVALLGRRAWADEATIGLVGGDVWGRFRTAVDVRAGVLFLRRPKVTGPASGRQRCSRAGAEPSEEACFELHQRMGPQGLEVSVAVWRDLPKGARVDLEVLGPTGEPAAPQCRVGLTFSPTDRGASTSHRLPWAPLAEALPECAQALRGATEVRFSLWEEEPVAVCSGTCAFVLDLAEQHISCECQGSPAADVSEAERDLLEKYRQQLRRK